MNHNHTHHPRSLRRRFGTLAAAGTALSAAGLVAVLGVAGAVHADDDDPPPVPNLDDLMLPEEPPIYVGPTIPLPDDDDPPIYVGPTIPIIPFDPSSPDDTLAPDDTAAPDDTTVPDDTAAPDTTTPGTTAPTTEPAPEAPTNAPSGDVAPFLEITSATVDCAAVLHVTFETGASPELAPDAEHVVSFSPASNPNAVMSQRLIHRPQNGVFTLDIQAPTAEQYRIIVTADFEPANLEGVLEVDEADAAAPTECPDPTPSG